MFITIFLWVIHFSKSFCQGYNKHSNMVRIFLNFQYGRWKRWLFHFVARCERLIQNLRLHRDVFIEFSMIMIMLWYYSVVFYLRSLKVGFVSHQWSLLWFTYMYVFHVDPCWYVLLEQYIWNLHSSKSVFLLVHETNMKLLYYVNIIMWRFLFCVWNGDDWKKW